MVAVIFEAVPAEGKKDEYFSIAEKLRPELIRYRALSPLNDFRALPIPERYSLFHFGKMKRA